MLTYNVLAVGGSPAADTTQMLCAIIQRVAFYQIELLIYKIFYNAL